MEKSSRLSTQKLAMIGVMTAVTCIMGPLSISIPISPVPISFTNLAVYLSVFVLGWKAGTLSYLMYLLLGFAGLPVFSGFTSGPAKLVGPTGGYLIGFIFAAIVSGWIIEKYSEKIHMCMLGMVLGAIVYYVFGTLWLSYLMKYSFIMGLSSGVIPYLPGDVAKMIFVAMVGPVLQKQLKRAGILQPQ